MDWCDRLAEDLVDHYCKGDPLQAMPWTREQMSEQELRRWLASREEAGRAIDVETCEIGCWFADDCDPYGILKMLEEFSEDTVVQISRNHFVRSPESNGWIWDGDLPTEKLKALSDRGDREYRRGLQ